MTQIGLKTTKTQRLQLVREQCMGCIVWECIAWPLGVASGVVRCVWLAKKGATQATGCVGLLLGCWVMPWVAPTRGGKRQKLASRRWTPGQQVGWWAVGRWQTIKSRPGVHAKPLTQGKPWEWCGGYCQGLAFGTGPGKMGGPRPSAS